LLAITALGAWSQTAREVPQVSLGVTRDADAAMSSIAVTGSGTSLRSEETMLVQVLGFPRALPADELFRTCRGHQWGHDPADDSFQLLLWNESGPDQAGTSTVDTTLHVPEGDFAVVCVGVLLYERNTDDPSDDRVAWAYTDLS
jgi:hypothetical protein